MILTIVTFFVILSILVLVHELGHFFVARWIGVRVEEFGLGLPPRIIGKKVGQTVYSLNWLPIGGFVKLAGEDEEPNGPFSDTANKSASESREIKQYFWARSKAERSCILIAGVTMNFLLAIILTAGLLVAGINEPSGRVHIERIFPGSPAQTAGMQDGDIIKSIVTKDKMVIVHTPADLIDTVRTYRGDPIMVNILRNDQEKNIQIIPRTKIPTGEGPLGVAISDLELKKYPVTEAPYKAITITFQRAGLMISGLAITLLDLVRFQKAPADIAGPIGIAQVTGQAVKIGLQAVIEFTSILSLNLAILNILPIPALDGGRLAFIFVEKILGRKIKPAFERQAHQIGMLILLFLVFLVSIGDIMRLARGG